jgi:hypothetical protein
MRPAWSPGSARAVAYLSRGSAVPGMPTQDLAPPVTDMKNVLLLRERIWFSRLSSMSHRYGRGPMDTRAAGPVLEGDKQSHLSPSKTCRVSPSLKCHPGLNHAAYALVPMPVSPMTCGPVSEKGAQAQRPSSLSGDLTLVPRGTRGSRSRCAMLVCRSF